MTNSVIQSPVHQALGDVWHELPAGLQAHYQIHNGQHRERGHLTVEYPRWLQWPLNLTVRMGALVNRRGQAIATTVERCVQDGEEHWCRTLVFSDGETKQFTSRTVCEGPMQIIEFSNEYLGLRMRLSFVEDCLRYDSDGYVLKMFGRLVRVPEWLALGYGCIEERAVADHRFVMDFRLRHPLFGRVFRYSGEFEVDTARNC